MFLYQLKNNMREGFVYRWYDDSNGKFYIGSHKGTTDDGYLGGGVLFRRAYAKRPNSFTREIIYKGVNYREYEQIILDYEDAANDDMFYNLVNSAWGGSKKGIPKSESTKIKMSEVAKGKAKSKSHRKAVSNSLKGKTGKDSRNAKKVYCEYLKKEFDTISDCLKELGISRSCYHSMKTGKTKNKYGIKQIKK